LGLIACAAAFVAVGRATGVLRAEDLAALRGAVTRD
jgi:hypothetical protein